MSPTFAAPQSETSNPSAILGAASTPLPVLRVPLLDHDRQLYAYELLFHREGSVDEQTLLQGVLGAITDGALTRLVRGNRAYLNLPAEMWPENADVLAHQPRLGIVLQPHVAEDAALMDRLEQMAQRGCQFLLDLADTAPDATRVLSVLLQMVQLVRLDATRLAPDVLAQRAKDLHSRGIHVVASQVNDHATFDRCAALPFEAVQGKYLITPQPVEVPVLTANRLSMLRLMGALHESNPGPVELGKIIRDDAVLSFKLLSCVNSAYFALPRQLKSVQQAAIFFGVSRMRNWIDTMAMCSMDDRPPELLRAALIRAHMCEGLAKLTSQGDPDMAFTVGLFSLLDVLMCAPMEYLLTQLRLAPEINDALTGRGGPFASVLKQILAWEAGELAKLEVTPQRVERLASIYLGATQWADQVYAGANGKSVQ